MRNKGFAYTADQKIARWDDIGGPRPFEHWALGGPLQFMASRLLTGLAGVVGALVVGWLLAGEAAFGMAVAGGFLIGAALIVLLAGHWMWKRERGVYDEWLNIRRHRQADAAVSTKPAHER